MSQFAGKDDLDPHGYAGSENGDSASELEEAPREGTLRWLALQAHEDVNGRELPHCHRIPAGSSWRSDAERGSRCALRRSDGSTCGAAATKRYGVCLVHCGGGADPRAIAAKGGAGKATVAGRARLIRQTFGIQSNSPRAVARMLAAARSEDVAAALLAPLDDRKLGSLDRQRAASVILGETFPLSSATIEVELPASAEDVGSMGWQDLQALAGRLLEG